MDGSSCGYAGEGTDASGLQYLRARYYSPAQGRFINKDPFPGLLTQPASLTPYAYALNSPVLYSDPSGEFVESPLDVLFIGYDLISVGFDVYRIATNRCDFLKEQLNRQLAIDAGALVIDLVFLAIPAPPGGGMGFRMAFAGANVTMDLARAAEVAYQGAKGLQWTIKGVQLGYQASNTLSFSRNSNYSQPPLPGMENYFGGGKTQEHHFVTNKGSFWPNMMRQITDKYNLDLDGSWNRQYIENHSGRHSDVYHQWVYNRLKYIDDFANGDVNQFLNLFYEEIVLPVMNDPTILYRR